MGEQDKTALLQLFDKKINRFITLSLSILGIFIILFISFMIQSSKKDGIQDTQIAQIIKIQDQREEQLDKLAYVVGVLTTNDAVSEKEITDITAVLNDILKRVKKAEWAILTEDPTKVSRGITTNKN